MAQKLLTFFFSLFILAQPAYAAEGIKISPVSFDLNGLPGQKVENVVKVSNPSDRDIAVTAEVSDFAPKGEEGGIELTSNYKYGLSHYVSIFPKSFSLKPGELQFVTVTIDIPKDAPAGARSGAVLFGSAAGQTVGSGSVISGQVGALFVLNILGDLKDQAKILGVSTPLAASRGPIDFSLRIQNTGSTVAKFQGTVSIYNLLGTKVAEVHLGPNNILPQAVRKFSGLYPEKDPVGIYRAEVSGAFGSTPVKTTFYFAGTSPTYLGPLSIAALILLVVFLHRRKKAS